MIKVVCWNMNYRRAAWRTLAQMGADVALLQEPCGVPPEVADPVEIEPRDHWKFWDSCLSEAGRPHRRPRIAKLSDRVTLDWFTPVPLLDPVSEDQIAMYSFTGSARTEISLKGQGSWTRDRGWFD